MPSHTHTRESGRSTEAAPGYVSDNTSPVKDVPPPTPPWTWTVPLALANYDTKHEAVCILYNKAFLVNLARRRLRAWYHEQGPVQWNRPIHHHLLNNEPPFQPMEPRFPCVLS